MFREKVGILKDILGGFYRAREEYLFECPNCNHHKKKLSVNISKNAYKCWICDYAGGKITSLVKKYGSPGQLSKWRELSNEVDLSSFDVVFRETEEVAASIDLLLPGEFISLVGQETSFAPKPFKYLLARGIGQEEIKKWKIGYCPSGEFGGRIVVPSFDSSGNLNYFVARLYASGWNKYKNPPVSRDIIFNDLNIDWAADLVLVEGVFDAIKADNAIPILGSSLRENSVLFAKIVEYSPKVYLALDKDVESKSQKIINNLLQHDVKVYKINLGGKSDVGEMSKKEFLERKRLASFIEREDYLLYKALTL